MYRSYKTSTGGLLTMEEWKMKDLYFKIIGQKSNFNKMILVAVVPVDMLGEVPDIFEAQAVKLSPTIFSGTYPNIRVFPDSIQDRTKELKGRGIAGIITSEQWYNKEIINNDPLDIGIKEKNK